MGLQCCVEIASVASSMACDSFPACVQGQGGSAVVAVDQSRQGAQAAWLAVGLSGGHAALADPRTGQLGAFWRAHDAGLTCLASCSEHLVLTGSQVPLHLVSRLLTEPECLGLYVVMQRILTIKLYL